MATRTGPDVTAGQAGSGASQPPAWGRVLDVHGCSSAAFGLLCVCDEKKMPSFVLVRSTAKLVAGFKAFEMNVSDLEVEQVNLKRVVARPREESAGG